MSKEQSIDEDEEESDRIWGAKKVNSLIGKVNEEKEEGDGKTEKEQRVFDEVISMLEKAFRNLLRRESRRDWKKKVKVSQDEKPVS